MNYMNKKLIRNALKNKAKRNARKLDIYIDVDEVSFLSLEVF